MGIFTRVRDIISANINALLDQAEDPEKMVKMIIREMEDTLVEVKASCAGAMATKKKIQRDHDAAQERANDWAGKAQLAMDKGREDLAREALLEKRRYVERAEGLAEESKQCEALVAQYKADIVQLEDKLSGAREKQRVLVQRHIRAQRKNATEKNIRKVDTADAVARFDHLENQIDQLESEAELVNVGRKPTLDEEFAKLDTDDALEKELDELKKHSGGDDA
jgi:phage shock protein A